MIKFHLFCNFSFSPTYIIPINIKSILTVLQSFNISPPSMTQRYKMTLIVRTIGQCNKQALDKCHHYISDALQMLSYGLDEF